MGGPGHERREAPAGTVAEAAATLPEVLRHDATGTPLHALIRQHVETFLARFEDEHNGRRQPSYVERELRAFLAYCRTPTRGVCRVRYPLCANDSPPPSTAVTKIWYRLVEHNRSSNMGKNTSISLGDHFEGYIASQVETGRYGNRSEVIRDALRDHEERQHRVEALRQALIEGEQSGAYRPFDMAEIIASAAQKAEADA